MRKVNNPCNRSYKHRCFLPGKNNTSPSLMMFLSLKLDTGGMNSQSCITLPLGVTIYYLAKAIKSNREHARILKNKIEKEKPNIKSSQSEHNLIIHRIPANTS